MPRIVLKPDRLIASRRIGPDRCWFWEELANARADHGRLRLDLESGDRVLLRHPDAASLAQTIEAVLHGPRAAQDELATTRQLGSIVSQWTAQSGFCAIAFAEYILCAAVTLDASDLHWEPVRNGYKLTLRRHGRLEPVATVPEAIGHRVVGRLKVMASVKVHRDDVVQEGRAALSDDDADVRLSFVPSVRGESATARLFDRLKGQATIAELGFEPALAQALRGLVDQPGVTLFAGASASGKTTTLYTALRDLVARADGHLRVVTIEDPVEYRLPGVVQLEVDASRGNSYSSLLRSVLRQDANVLVVGEIRDAETAQLAMRAGLTGHCVLTTVHAGDTREALLRLGELGVQQSVIESAVRGVFWQTLEPVCEGDDVIGRKPLAAVSRLGGRPTAPADRLRLAV